MLNCPIECKLTAFEWLHIHISYSCTYWRLLFISRLWQFCRNWSLVIFFLNSLFFFYTNTKEWSVHFTWIYITVYLNKKISFQINNLESSSGVVFKIKAKWNEQNRYLPRKYLATNPASIYQQFTTDVAPHIIRPNKGNFPNIKQKIWQTMWKYEQIFNFDYFPKRISYEKLSSPSSGCNILLERHVTCYDCTTPLRLISLMSSYL